MALKYGCNLTVYNWILQVEEVNVYPILLGGDQLTVARARSAQLSMSGELTACSRLEGLVPIFEDWHTKQALLIVSSNSAQ